MRIKLLALLALAGCGSGSEIPGHDPLVRQIESRPVGASSDHWIEMQNISGQWERTGLIFGYGGSDGDRDEYQKAIAGLKKANPAREYRCSRAN